MIYAFPAADKLWADYARVRAEGLRADRGIIDATAFYGKHRSAMDEGVMGCEVWMKLVEYSQTLPQRDGTTAVQPSDERALIDPFLGDLATFRFLGVATRTPHITKFSLEARGQSAVYMLRPPRRICDWVSTRGTPGPWSDIAAATVAA